MARIEEECNIGASGAAGELMELPVKSRLIKICAQYNLEAEPLKCGGYVLCIVRGVGKARLTDVVAVPDNESDARLRKCRLSEKPRYQCED